MLNILSRRLAYAQSTDCGNHVLHVPLLAPNLGGFSVADDEADVRRFYGRKVAVSAESSTSVRS